MPGIYLGAILLSLGGMVAIDLRYSLALRPAPWRTVAAVVLATGVFLLWDALGIVTGVFVKGDSPLFVGVDLAPHLPLEELFFLLFLSYLTIVLWSAIQRRARRAHPRRTDDEAAA